MTVNITPANRIIFTKTPLGKRQIKETLADLFVSLLLKPNKIILVSPWISDFDLLDNRSGQWNSLESKWGYRIIRFSEILTQAMYCGCQLQLVTNKDKSNQAFVQKLQHSVPEPDIFKYIQSEYLSEENLLKLQYEQSETLHIKGLLTHDFFLSGSMNFTYSGTNINDEQIQLILDKDTILEATLEFKDTYGL